jgi:hypothetical protein
LTFERLAPFDREALMLQMKRGKVFAQFIVVFNDYDLASHKAGFCRRIRRAV